MTDTTEGLRIAEGALGAYWLSGMEDAARIITDALAEKDARIAELREALSVCLAGISVIHQYRGILVDCIGNDGEAIRAAERSFNKAHDARLLARAALEKTNDKG